MLVLLLEIFMLERRFQSKSRILLVHLLQSSMRNYEFSGFPSVNAHLGT